MFGKMWILGLLLAFIAEATAQDVPGVDIAIRDESREVYCPMHCFCDMEYAHCGNGGFTTFPVNLDMKIKHIMLQNNRLRSLRNEELRYYKTVESINLHGNHIERIERGAFKGLTNVKKLNLARNRLRYIDKTTFEGLDNLEILNVEGNEINDLTSALEPLTKLRVLRAGSNKLTALRKESFKHTQGLHRLNVSFNEISHMDRDVLKPMPYLRYLILNNNPLGDSASNLNLDNNRWIYFVDFTNTQMKSMIKNLPPTISDVRLQNNEIQRLYRDDFANATHLDLLLLNNNMLRDVEPGALDHLEHLRELWLTRNRLQRFPRLPHNVRAVHLDHNDIRQIQSRDLESSPNVEFLYLQKNNIRRIASQSFKDMQYLRSLILRENQLNELESYTFVNLTNLDFVDLSINPIRRVDRASFSQLDNLRRLTMSRVEQPTVVRDLDMLQQMKHLRMLDMSQSPGLANSFAQSDVILPEVQDLNLMYSDLVTLPRDFPRRVPNINIIKLAGNKYHCNQSLTWMPAWLRRKPAMFFARHLITCTTPLALKDRPIFSVPMSEFRKVVGPPDYEEWRRLPTCKDCPCDEKGVPITTPTRRPFPTRGPDFPTGDVLVGGDEGTDKRPTGGRVVGPDGRVIVDSNVKDHKNQPDSGSRVEGTGDNDLPKTTKTPATKDEVDPEKWPDKEGEDFTDTDRKGGDTLDLDYEEPTTTMPTTTTRAAVLPVVPKTTGPPTTTTQSTTTTTTQEPTTTAQEPTTTTQEPTTTTQEPTTTSQKPTTTTADPTTTTTKPTTTTTEPTTTTLKPTTTTSEPTTTTPEPTTTTTTPVTTTETITTTTVPTTTPMPTTTQMPTTTTPEPTTTTTESTTTTTTEPTTTTTVMTTTKDPKTHISILLGGDKVDREVLETILIKMGRSLAAFRTGLWRVYVFGTKGKCSSLPQDRVNATETRIIEVMSNDASTSPDVMRRVLKKVLKVRKQVDDKHTGIEVMEHMLQEMAKKMNVNREELVQILLNIFTRTMQCGTTGDPEQSPEALVDEVSRRLGLSPDIVQGIVWRLFTTGLDYMMKEPEENRVAYMMQIYPSLKYMVRALAFRSGVSSYTFRIRLFNFTKQRDFITGPFCLLKDFAKELDIPDKQMSQVLREIFYTGMDPATVVGTSQYLHGSPLMHYTIYGMAQDLGIPLRTLRHQLWQIFYTTTCNTDHRKYLESVKLWDEISQKLNINITDILNLVRATFLTGVFNVYMEPTNMTLISNLLEPLYFFTVQGMADNMDMKVRHMREIFWSSLIADSDVTTEDLALQFDIPNEMFQDVLKWMFRPDVRPSMAGKNLPTVERMAKELYIPEKTYIGYITELLEGVHYESDIGRVRTKMTELAKELYIPEIDLHHILRKLYKLGNTETIARAASFHYVTMPNLNLTFSQMKGVLRTMIYLLYRDFTQIQDYITNGQTTTTTTVEPPPKEPTIGPKWNLTLLQEMAADLQIPEVIFKKTLKDLLRKMISSPDREAHQSFLSSVAGSLYIPTDVLSATLRKLYTNTPRMTNQYMTGYIEQNLPNIGMSGFNTSIALLRLQRALKIRDQPSFGIDIMSQIRRPQDIKRSLLEPALTKLLHEVDVSKLKDETKQIIRNVSQEFRIPFTTFKSILRELLSFYNFPSIENTSDYIYANFINLTIGSLETKDALSKVAAALLDLEKKQELVKVEETNPLIIESETGKVLEGKPTQATSIKQIGFFIEDKEYKYPPKELDLLFGEKKIPRSKQQRTLDVVLQTAYENGKKNVTGETKVFVNGNEVKLDEAKLKRLLNVLGISIDGTGDDKMTFSLLRQLIIAAYSLKTPEEGTGASVFGRGDSDIKPDAYVRINKQDYLLPEDFIERIYDSFTLPQNAIRNLILKFKTTGGSLYAGTGQTTVYVNDKYVPINPEELKQIRDVYGFTTKPMFLRLTDELVMKLYEIAIGPDSLTDNQPSQTNATIIINSRRYPLGPEQIYNIFGTRYIPESTMDLNLRFDPSGTRVYVNGRVAVLSDRDTKLLKRLFGADTIFDPLVASEQLPTRLLKKLFEAAVRTHPIATAQPTIAGNIIFYINGKKYELPQSDVKGLFGAQEIPSPNQRVLELNFLPLSKNLGKNDIKVLINGNEMPLPQDRLQEIKRVVMADSTDPMTPALLKLLIRYAFSLNEAGSGDTNKYITILGQPYLLPQDVIRRIFGSPMIPGTAPRTLQLKFRTRGGSLEAGTGITTVTVNGKWVNLTTDELGEIRDVYAYSKNPQNTKYAKLSDALVVNLYETAMSPEQDGNFITINRERYQLTPNEVREIFDADSVPPAARKGLTLRFVGDDSAPSGNVMVFVNDQLASLSDVDILLLKAVYNWGPSVDPESPTDIPPTYIIKKLFQALSTAAPLTTQEPQIVFLVNEKPFYLMQSEAARLFGKHPIPLQYQRKLEVGFRDEAGSPVAYINGNKGWLLPAERTIVRQVLGLDEVGGRTQDMPKPILKKLIRIAFSLPEVEEKGDRAEVDEPTKEAEDTGKPSPYIFINKRRYRIPAGTIQRIFGDSMIPSDVNRTLELKFKTTGGSFYDGTGQTSVTVNDNPIQLARYELSQIRDAYFFSTNPLPPELVVQLFETAFGTEEAVTDKAKGPKPYIVINGIVYELTPAEVQTLFGTGELPPLAYRSLNLTFKNGGFGPSKVIVNGTETSLSGADVMILNAIFGHGVAQPGADKPPTYLLEALFNSLAQISIAPPTTTQVVPEKEVYFWINEKEYWLPESVTLQIFDGRSTPAENQRNLEVTFRADDGNAVYVNGTRGVISPKHLNKLRAILGLDHEGTPSPIMTRPLLVNLVQIAFGLQVSGTGSGNGTGDSSRPSAGSTTFTREDGGADMDRNYVTVRGKRYLLPTKIVTRIFGSQTIPRAVSRNLALRFETVGGAFTEGTGTTTFTVNNRPVQLTTDELQQLRDVYGYSNNPQYTRLTTDLVSKLFEAGLVDDTLGPDEPEAPTESDRGSRIIMIRGQEYLIPVPIIQRAFGSSFIPAARRRSLELKFKTVGGSFREGTGQTTVQVNDKQIKLSSYELNQIRDVFGYSRTPQHTRLSSELAVKLFEAAYGRTDSTSASGQEFQGLIINGQKVLLTPQESEELFGAHTLPSLQYRTLSLVFEKPDSGFGISKVFVNGSATDITGADVLILEALYGRETTQSTGDALAQEKPPIYLLKMLFQSVKSLQPISTAASTTAPEEQVIFLVADKEYGLPKSVVLRMFGNRGIPSAGERYIEAFFRGGQDGKVTVNGNEGDLEPKLRNRLRAILGLAHHQIDGSEKAVMTDELLRRIVIIAFSLPETAGTGDVSATAAGGSSTGGRSTGGVSTAAPSNEIEIHGQKYTLSSDAVNRFYGQSTLPASAPRNLTMEFTTVGGSFERGTGRSFATVNRLNIHLTKSEFTEIRDVWGYTTNPRYSKLTPELVEKIYEVVVDKNWRSHTGGVVVKQPDYYDGSLAGEGANTFTREATGEGGQTFSREDSITGEDSLTGEDSITGGTDGGGQGAGGTDSGGQGPKRGAQGTGGTDRTGAGTGGTGRGGTSQGGTQDRAGHYITIHGQEYRLPNSTIQKLFGSSTLPKTARRAIELRFKTTGGSFYDGTGQTTVTVNTKPLQLTANELQQIRDVYGFSKSPQYDRLSTELVSKIFETAILDVITGVEATVTNENITKGRQDRFISIHGQRYLLPVDTVQRIYGQSTLPETAIRNLELDFKTVGGSFYEGTGTTTISVNGKPIALDSHEMDWIRRTEGFTATPEFQRLSPEIVVKLYDTALSGVNVRPQEGRADRKSPVAAIFMINGNPYNITRADYDAIFGDQGLPAGSQKALSFLVKYTSSPRDDLMKKTVYVNGKKVDFTETELDDFLSTYKQDGEVIGSRMPIHLVRKVIAAAYDRQLASQMNTMQRSFLINGRSYELTLKDITSIFGVQGIPRGADQSIRLTFLGANQVTVNGYHANLSDEEYQELKDSSLRNYDLAQPLVHKIIRIAYGFSGRDTRVYSFQINGQSYNVSRQQLRTLYGSDSIPSQRVLQITWKPVQDGANAVIFINGERTEIPSHYMQALMDSSKKALSTDLLHLILKKAHALWIRKSTEGGTGLTTQSTTFTVNGRGYTLTPAELHGLFPDGQIPAGDNIISVSTSGEAIWTGSVWVNKYKGEIDGTVIDMQEQDVDNLRRKSEISRPLLMRILRAAYKLTEATGTESSGSISTGVKAEATSSGSTVFTSETRDTDWPIFYINGRSYNLTDDEVETIFGITGLPAAEGRRLQVSYKTSSSWLDGSFSVKTSVFVNGKKVAFTDEDIDFLRNSTDNLPRPLLITLLKGVFAEGDDSGPNNTGTGSSNTGTGSSSTGAGSTSTGSGSSSAGTGSASAGIGSNSTGTESSSSSHGSTGTRSGSSNAGPGNSSHSGSTVFTSETRGTTAPTFILNGRSYMLEPEEVETIFGITGLPETRHRTLLITFKTNTAQTGDTFKTETRAYVNGRRLTLTETQMLSLRSSGRVDIPRSLLHILLSTAFETDDTAGGQRLPSETSTTKPKSQPSFYINGRSYKLSPLEVSSVFGNISLPESGKRMIRISFRTSSKQTDDGRIHTTTNVYANEKKASLTDEEIQQVRVSRTQELPRKTLYILLKTAFVLPEESEREPMTPTVLPSEMTTTKIELIYINGRRYGLQPDEIRAIFGHAGLPAYRRRTLRVTLKKSSSQTDGVFNNKTIVFVSGIKANLSDVQIRQLEKSISSEQDIPRHLLHILLKTAFVEIGGTAGLVLQINGRQYELSLDEIDAVFGTSKVPPSGQALRLSFKALTTQTNSGPRTETILEINGRRANLTEAELQQVRESTAKDLSRDLLYTLLRTAFGLTGNGQKTIASGSTVYTSGTRGNNNRGFTVNGRQYELTTDEVEMIFGVAGLPAPEQREMQVSFRTSTVKSETGLYRSQTSVYVNGKKLNLTDQQVQQMRDSSTRDISRTLLHLILRTAFVETAPEVESGSSHTSGSTPGKADTSVAFNINGKSYELSRAEVGQVFGEAGAPMDRTLQLTFKTSSMQTGTGFSSETSIHVNGKRANLTPEQVQHIKNTGAQMISRAVVYTLLRTAYGDDSHDEVPEVSTTVSTTLIRPAEVTRFHIGGRSYDLTAQEVMSVFGNAAIPPENDRSIRVSFRTSTSKVGDSYITTTSAYANGKKLTLTAQEVKQLKKAGYRDISDRLLRIIIRTAFDLPVPDTETLAISTTETSVMTGMTRFYLGGRGYDLTSQEVSLIFGESDPPPKDERTVALTFKMTSSQTDGGSSRETSVFVNGKRADLTGDEVQQMRNARAQDISRSLLLKILQTAYTTMPESVTTVKPTRTNTFYVNNRPYDLTEKELDMLLGDADVPPQEQRQVLITFRSKSRLSWTGWKTTTTVSVNGKEIDLSDEEVTAMKASAVTDLSRDLLMKILRSAYETGTSGFQQLAATPITYDINGQDYEVSLADYRRIFGRAKRLPDGRKSIIMTFRTGVEIIGDGWGVVNTVYLNDRKGDFTEQQVRELKESTNSQKKIADDLVLLIIKSAFGEVQAGPKKEVGQVGQGQLTYFNINGKQVGFSGEEMQRIFGTTGQPPVMQRTILMSFRSRAVQNGKEWTTETTVKINGKEVNFTTDEKNKLRLANTQDSYESIPRGLLHKILKSAFNGLVTAKQTTPAMVNFEKTKGTEAAIQIESKEITVSHDELSKVLGAAFSPASRSSMEIKFSDGKVSGEGEAQDVSVFVNGQKIFLTPEETREIAEYYAESTSRDAEKMYKERVPDGQPTSGRTLSPQLIQKIIDATSDGRSAEDGGKGEAIEEGANIHGAGSREKKPSTLLETIRRGGAENGQNDQTSTSQPKNMQVSHPVEYAVSDYPEDQPRKDGDDNGREADEQLRKDEEVWKMMYRMFKF